MFSRAHSQSKILKTPPTSLIRHYPLYKSAPSGPDFIQLSINATFSLLSKNTILIRNRCWGLR